MAYKEDYLNERTIPIIDEIDRYLSTLPKVEYPTASTGDHPSTYSVAIDDPLPPPKFQTLPQMMRHNNDPMPKQVIENASSTKDQR